ncbi:MAG: sensor histidine kinase [Planctomycetaceae bacterium]
MSEGPSPKALEFLGRLAGGLVHEIKNPLSTLTINLTLLKEDLQAALPGDRALGRRVETLETEVRRLESVLEDFMRYAGARRPALVRRDLAAIVGEMAEFLRPGFTKDGIELRCAVDPAPVLVDAGLFKQALLNVLLNAQQALGRGGRVTVTGGVEGAEALLVVTDDGPGIAPDVLPRVFDVYFSASRKGSGLGLPTARRIMEEHGGGIGIASTPGRGTVVTMRLRRAEGA